MKKTAMLITALVLVLTLLSACGGKNDKAADSGSASASPSGEGSKLSGDLTVWVFSDDFIVNSAKQSAASFKQQYPDVNINIVPVAGGDVHMKLLAAIASGSGVPDVAHIGVWDPMKFIDQDALTDLTDLVKPFESDILPYQLPPYQKDGKTYGVPWGGTAASVFYRRDVFEKAGIKPESIKTWNDYIEAGKKIVTSTGGKVKMLNLPVGNSVEKASLNNFQQLLAQQLGTGIYNDKGETVINDENNLKAFNLIKQMIDAGIGANIDPWTPAEFAAWKDGSIASVVNASWMKGSIEGQAKDTSGKWGIFELPAFEAGGTQVSSAGGSGMVIPKASKNQEAAKAFVKFFLLNKDQQIAAYKIGAPVPSLISSYSDPVFSEQNAFWGGQKVGEFYTKIEPKVPAYYYSANYREAMLQLLPAGIWEALTGNKDAKAALDDVKSKMEQKFGK